jgi:hypothetical protein
MNFRARVATCYGLDGRSSIPGSGNIFLFFIIASRQALGTTQPPIQWALSSEVKRHGREANHSPPSSAEVKNGGAILPLPLRLHYIFYLYLKYSS